MNPFENILPKTQENSLVVPKSDATLMTIPAGSKGIIYRVEFNNEAKQQLEAIQTELSVFTTKAIASQDDCVKANQTLKKAKTLIKSLHAERLTMSGVLDAEIKALIDYERKITEPLSNLVQLLDTAITNFQKEQDRIAKEKAAEIERQKQEALRKEQEEINRVSRIKNLIISFENNVMNAIHTANINDIDEKIDKLSKIKLNEETYMEFLPDAQIMYQNCVTKMNERKTELMKLAQAEAENAELATKLKAEQDAKLAAERAEQEAKQRQLEAEKEEQELIATSNIQMNAELQNSMIEKQKGVMKKWSFDEESIDMSLLPLEYHTFDKKKIKEAIAAGAREIPGVKIFQDLKNVSR
jgi:hypothetical protein